MRQLFRIQAVALGLIAFSNQGLAEPTSTQPTAATGLAAIRADAKKAQSLVRTELAREFLRASAHLPSPKPRKIYRDAERKYHSAGQYKRMTKEQRSTCTGIDVTEDIYYYTKYGTPLAYMRPLELLGQVGLKDANSLRVLDYGYGGVGPLRLLSILGADAVGVDVDPFLPALYSDPQDHGIVHNEDKTGSVKMVHGRWPADAATKENVGEGFDLILSKNTLKNGYLHPEKPVDKRMLIDLGVPEEQFVKAVFDALKPGGHFMIYNICPAPAPPDKPYIPWADGRCPFAKELLEKTGFRIIKIDEDDSKAVREMARALGWDKGEGAMDVEKDLFAHYTLLRRPG